MSTDPISYSQICYAGKFTKQWPPGSSSSSGINEAIIEDEEDMQTLLRILETKDMIIRTIDFTRFNVNQEDLALAISMIDESRTRIIPFTPAPQTAVPDQQLLADRLAATLANIIVPQQPSTQTPQRPTPAPPQVNAAESIPPQPQEVISEPMSTDDEKVLEPIGKIIRETLNKSSLARETLEQRLRIKNPALLNKINSLDHNSAKYLVSLVLWLEDEDFQTTFIAEDLIEIRKLITELENKTPRTEDIPQPNALPIDGEEPRLTDGAPQQTGQTTEPPMCAAAATPEPRTYNGRRHSPPLVQAQQRTPSPKKPERTKRANEFRASLELIPAITRANEVLNPSRHSELTALRDSLLWQLLDLLNKSKKRYSDTTTAPLLQDIVNFRIDIEGLGEDDRGTAAELITRILDAETRLQMPERIITTTQQLGQLPAAPSRSGWFSWPSSCILL